MAILYADNFDADTLLALPTGWTGDPGMVVRAANPVSAPNGLGRGVTTDGSLAWYTGASTADGSVALSLVLSWTGGLVGAGGLLFEAMAPSLRSDGTGNNFYFAWIDPSSGGGSVGGIHIAKFVGGGFSALGTISFPSHYFNAGSPRDLVSGDKVHIRFQAIGTTLSVKAWLDGDAEPASYLGTTVTDGSLTAAGFGGVRATGTANVAPDTFDDFAFYDNSVAPDPTTATLTGPTAGRPLQESTAFTVTLDHVVQTGTVVVHLASTGSGDVFHATSGGGSVSSITILPGHSTGTFLLVPSTTQGSRNVTITTTPALTYVGTPHAYLSQYDQLQTPFSTEEGDGVWLFAHDAITGLEVPIISVATDPQYRVTTDGGVTWSPDWTSLSHPLIMTKVGGGNRLYYEFPTQVTPSSEIHIKMADGWASTASGFVSGTADTTVTNDFGVSLLGTTASLLPSGRTLVLGHNVTGVGESGNLYANMMKRADFTGGTSDPTWIDSRGNLTSSCVNQVIDICTGIADATDLSGAGAVTVPTPVGGFFDLAWDGPVGGGNTALLYLFPTSGTPTFSEVTTGGYPQVTVVGGVQHNVRRWHVVQGSGDVGIAFSLHCTGPAQNIAVTAPGSANYGSGMFTDNALLQMGKAAYVRNLDTFPLINGCQAVDFSDLQSSDFQTVGGYKPGSGTISYAMSGLWHRALHITQIDPFTDTYGAFENAPVKCTSVGHGLKTGQLIVWGTTPTVHFLTDGDQSPAGFSYVLKIDADHFACVFNFNIAPTDSVNPSAQTGGGAGWDVTVTYQAQGAPVKDFGQFAVDASIANGAPKGLFLNIPLGLTDAGIDAFVADAVSPFVTAGTFNKIILNYSNEVWNRLGAGVHAQLVLLGSVAYGNGDTTLTAPDPETRGMQWYAHQSVRSFTRINSYLLGLGWNQSDVIWSFGSQGGDITGTTDVIWNWINTNVSLIPTDPHLKLAVSVTFYWDGDECFYTFQLGSGYDSSAFWDNLRRRSSRADIADENSRIWSGFYFDSVARAKALCPSLASRILDVRYEGGTTAGGGMTANTGITGHPANNLASLEWVRDPRQYKQYLRHVKTMNDGGNPSVGPGTDIAIIFTGVGYPAGQTTVPGAREVQWATWTSSTEKAGYGKSNVGGDNNNRTNKAVFQVVSVRAQARDDWMTSSSSPPPDAVTGGATSVLNTSAVLNAAVNPEGTDTSVVWVYGTDPTLSTGTTTTSAQDAGSGSSSSPFSILVTGLSAATTYYNRVVATSSAGTTDGSILSFTTRAASTTRKSTKRFNPVRRQNEIANYQPPPQPSDLAPTSFVERPQSTPQKSFSGSIDANSRPAPVAIDSKPRARGKLDFPVRPVKGSG